MTWLLTYGITNAVLALPLAVLAYLVARWSQRPALAHLVWIAVLVKLVTPPIISVPVGWEINPQAWVATAERAALRPDSTATLSNVSPATTPSDAAAQSTPAKRSAKRVVSQETQQSLPERDVAAASPTPASRPLITPAGILAFFAWTWLIGAAVMLVRSLYHGWLFQRTLRTAGHTDDWLNTRLARIARGAGLRTWPQVVVVEGIFSPMLWGVGRRARLVFPAELRARLDIPACDSLLLHELAHYSRGDHWVRLLELATQTLYWWHPVVWWSSKEIEAAEEHCCDAWVIAHQQGTRRSYAEALLATIDFLNEQSPSLPPVACGLGEISLLRRRLTQIMHGDVSATISPAMKLAVVAWAVVIAPLAPTVFAAASPSATKQSPVPRIAEVAPSRPAESHTPAREADALPPRRVGVSRSDASPKARPLPRENSSYAQRIRSSTPWSPPPLWGAAVSPSGNYRLEVRTAQEGRRITLINTATNRTVDMTAHEITGASFSSDSRLATGHDNGDVRIFDSGGGYMMKLAGAKSAITSVAFSADSRYVTAGTAAGDVLVWDATFGDLLVQLPPQQTAVSCVRWSPTGDRIAISLAPWDQGEAAELLVWNPTRNAIVHEFTLPMPAAALSWRDEDRLAVIGWGTTGDIWQLSTGERMSQFTVEKDVPSAANWSPDCPFVLHPQLPEPSQDTLPADALQLEGLLAEAR